MIEITPKSATPAPAILRRLASMLYESLLVLALLFITSYVYLQFRNPEVAGGRIFYQLYLVLVMASYFIWFWTHGGRTLAMKTWRLRLVSADGGAVSTKQAALRFALAIPGILLLGVSIWWALVDPEKQFLHDRLAGTRLIKTD